MKEKYLYSYFLIKKNFRPKFLLLLKNKGFKKTTIIDRH